MKLTQTRESMLEALQTTLGAIEKKQTSAILENVLLNIEAGQAHWKGTDLELEIATTTPLIDGEVGSVTLPARKLTDICKSLPPESLIALDILDNHRAVVHSGRSRFELSTLPAADYPALDDLGDHQQITLPEADFRHLLESTAFAMANQDVRYYLNGLLLELNQQHIRTVTTDGHRLALCTYDNPLPESSPPEDSPLQVIIPRKGVMELVRLLRADSQVPVTVQISQNHLRVQADQLRFTSKLIDGRYPDYQAAVPAKGQIAIDLDRKALKDTLSRVSILSNDKFRGVRIHLETNLFKVQSNNPEQDIAHDELDISYGGDNFNIGFNVTYLLDALNHISNDTVTLQLNSPESSALITDPEDPCICHVIMPIRL